MVTDPDHKRILIVDDEAEIVKLLTFGLSGPSLKIESCSSGREAIQRVAAQPPQCILLDVGLPEVSGLEVLRELRSFSSVPVIMLTVEDRDALKVKALELGADDYVTKPFSMPVLKARIQAVMRRSGVIDPQASPLGPSFYESPTLRIDFKAHKTWAHDKEVHLTATEFELLTYFIANRGMVLTHRQILAKIWGDQAGDQMHYLRVYISQLRRKVEANPAIPKLIVTEPGIGYRFEG